jgi:CHAT domain-containing protein
VNGPRIVPDRVISSYTSTARALARPRPAEDAVPATLIVPVPDLPGAALPGVNSETKAISSLIHDAYILHQPTRATVLAALPTHKVAHFACHGHADWRQPAESRLLLADYATNPLTLAHITALHLDADLAYLSACSTTVTAPRLADESLHITGAFHLAGYRHVIGTLWPIDDTAAAEIATAFYQHLTANGAPRPEHAAHALHHATMLLRARYPNSPSLWAAHIHTGR